MVLGPQQPSHALELPGGQHSVDFHVEGLAFPDASFSGLVSLTVSLLGASKPVGPERGPGLPGSGPTWGGGGAVKSPPGEGAPNSCWEVAVGPRLP